MTIFVTTGTLSAFSKTLQQHITDTQRLLHDSSNYFSQQSLTDWINEGRWKVVEDTGCNRVLQSITTAANKEIYTFATDFPYGSATINVLNATLIWGNKRVNLIYCVWTKFNFVARGVVGFNTTPRVWSQYGQQAFYLGPIADQVYTVEMDTVVLPNLLVNLTDVDTLNFPFLRAVSYWAAYKAKQNDQLPQEAEVFRQGYLRTIKEIQYATNTRRITAGA